jgi:hypothetical protein
MTDRLGPSRLGEVLDPLLLAGSLLAAVGGAGLALGYDHARSTTAIQLIFLVLLLPSCCLVMPYIASIGRQGLQPGFPLWHVGWAAAGCAGFAAMIGLAISRPTSTLEGGLPLAIGLVLIGVDLRLRRRRRGPVRNVS